MSNNAIRVFFAGFLMAAVLGGCAQFEQLRGTGGGTDDYKDSPCACGPVIPQERPEYLDGTA